LLGLSVFPLFEVGCRLGGWGAEPPPATLLDEFAGTRPLFALSADGNQYRIAKDRRQYFADEFFPAKKSANTLRIFVLGGSTVQGRPFSIPTSFPTFLNIGLDQADPEKNWEVINCGGISYASYRLLPILEECLQYEPDLFLVCSGHNEFLECVTYGDLLSTPSAVQQSRLRLDQLHSFRVARQLFSSSGSDDSAQRQRSLKTLLPEEVDALLDHQGGLAAYHRKALHRERIVASFGNHLEQMVHVSRSAKVPIVLMSPPSNLCDCPPFKSEFSSQTTPETRQLIRERLEAAVNLSGEDQLRSLQLTAGLDSSFAFSWYQYGKALMQANRIEEAEGAFQYAQDEDVCPLRMTTQLRRTMHQVALDQDVPYLDVQHFLKPVARRGLMGDSLLVDHVHPSFATNQRIALELVERVATLADIHLQDDWQTIAATKFEDHLQSLNDFYFLSGRRTLETLKAWTQGRAEEPPMVMESE